VTSDALSAPQPGAPLDDEPSERRPGRSRRRGPRRRPGEGGSRPSSTQEAILTAARESFLTQGYEGTTIRAVARAAGVDPALVSYYFGSKGDLFGAAVNLRVRASQEIATAISGDLLSAGPRLVRLSLTAWDDDADGATFRSLLQWMATDTRSPEAIQNYATEQIAAPMAEALEQSGLSVASPRERATLAGSQLVGLAMIRYVLRLEPIASASIDHLAEVVGPTIQRYLTGPLQSA